MGKNLYALLGVPKDASKEDLKKAYRKKAIQCHPDKNKGDPKAEEQFKELSEAYSILSNDQQRQLYDQYGIEGVKASTGSGTQGNNMGGFSSDFNFRDIFDGVFGDGAGIFESFFGSSTRQKARSKRGQDLGDKITLNLEDVLSGKEVVLEVKRNEPCSDCSGTGAKPGSRPKPCPDCHGTGQVRQSRGFFSISSTCPRCRGQGQLIDKPCSACYGNGVELKNTSIRVNIPPGIDHGQQIKIPGEGEATGASGLRGDFFLDIEVKPHPYFVRDEHALYCEIPIQVHQAVLGSDIFVKTLDGKRIKIRIPPGVQDGNIVRIPREGLPILNAGRRGDLHVAFKIHIPKRTSSKERQIYENLGRLSGDHSEPTPITQNKKRSGLFR